MKLFVTLLLLAPISALSQTIDTAHELLWEISGNGIQTSYLFGTMHTNDRRVYNLSDSTYVALDQAEIIACEVDIFSAFEDLGPLTETIDLNYDKYGNPFTSSSRASKRVYGDEDGMPQPLDAYFQQFSSNAGKLFEPLESIESQINVVKDFSLTPDWKGIHLDAIMYDEVILLNKYIAGDISVLDEMMKNSMSGFPGLYEAMIVDRNKTMSHKLDSLMHIKSVFCAIGAGHLAGSRGVIKCLEHKGYHVRKVLASYSEDSDISRSVRSYRSTIYENDSIHFGAVFPGQPQEVHRLFDGDDLLLRLIYRDLGQGNTYEVEVYLRKDDLPLDQLAKMHIPSPRESTIEKIVLEDTLDAYQGIGHSYTDGTHWVRVMASGEKFLVIKASGGNKFMNSPRPFRFFDAVWLD